ncbi:MAG: peptide deformylase [Lachnospiraceae bacterium]|nr:peptide deformylase [Lachnospiraceae bacterium]
MAIRNIRVMGDDILRKTSKPVKKVTERTKTMIEDMLETMYETQGVGLAAPQIGVLKRIVVIDVGEGPYILINPVITEKSGEQTGDEGCLSIPNKIAEVTRPDHVICEALDEDLQPFTVEAEGLFARAICHECDHLDGILYPDVANGPLVDLADLQEEEEEEQE